MTKGEKWTDYDGGSINERRSVFEARSTFQKLSAHEGRSIFDPKSLAKVNDRNAAFLAVSGAPPLSKSASTVPDANTILNRPPTLEDRRSATNAAADNDDDGDEGTDNNDDDAAADVVTPPSVYRRDDYRRRADETVDKATLLKYHVEGEEVDLIGRGGAGGGGGGRGKEDGVATEATKWPPFSDDKSDKGPGEFVTLF